MSEEPKLTNGLSAVDPLLPILAKLTRTDKKALATRSGQGNFSSAVFRRLFDLGLVDWNFCWTDKGWEARKRLGIRSE